MSVSCQNIANYRVPSLEKGNNLSLVFYIRMKDAQFALGSSTDLETLAF